MTHVNAYDLELSLRTESCSCEELQLYTQSVMRITCSVACQHMVEPVNQPVVDRNSFGVFHLKCRCRPLVEQLSSTLQTRRITLKQPGKAQLSCSNVEQLNSTLQAWQTTVNQPWNAQQTCSKVMTRGCCHALVLQLRLLWCTWKPRRCMPCLTHSDAALHACSAGAAPGHVNALSASCWPVLLWASASHLRSQHIVRIHLNPAANRPHAG